MQLATSFFIALRYWRAKSADRFGRLVSHLASLGITLGVMALVIVLSVMNGLEHYQKQKVLETLPHAQLMLQQGYFSIGNATPPLPPLVQKAVPMNTTNVILQTSSGLSAGQAVGIQHFSDDPLLSELSENEFAEFLPMGEFKLIIGSRLAESLNLQVGDKIRLMITENSQYTPFGRIPTQRLFQVSHIYDSLSEQSSYQVFANLSDLGRLMRIPANQFQSYRLFLDDPFYVTELSQYFPPTQWKMLDWRVQKGEFFQAVRMEKNMMGLLISLIIIVAISNILTSLSLMVVDKQGEIAILRTLGLNKAQVRHIFILQGGLVGLVGTIIGAVLGIAVTLNLESILRFINPLNLYLPSKIEPLQIIIIMLASLLCSLLSTLYPAYRAAQIEPAVALRYE